MDRPGVRQQPLHSEEPQGGYSFLHAGPCLSVALLRTHEKAHDALAEAMQRGETVRLQDALIAEGVISAPMQKRQLCCCGMLLSHRSLLMLGSGGRLHPVAREHARQLGAADGGGQRGIGGVTTGKRR
jgi:hypothetical protein